MDDHHWKTELNVKQPDYNFCMKQFKPAIILIAVLAALVLGWTVFSVRAHPDKGFEGMMDRQNALQVATAPPIRAGTKAPHADFGPCLNCHVMVPPPPPVPDGQIAPHPDWGKCTDCHKMIRGVGKRVAATMQVATMVPALGGVWLRPITAATADRLGLDNAHGVLVSGVLGSSPAFAAGLRVGDVIHRVDNKKVETLGEAMALIAGKGPQDTVKLQVLRAGRELKIFIKVPGGLQSQPQSPAILAAAAESPASRIAVAATGKSLDSQVATSFGSAPAFVLYDPATGRLSSLDNPGAGSLTAGSQAASQLIDGGVGAVIVGSIGPSSSSRLRQSGIQVYSGAFGPVRTVIDQYLQGALVAADGTVIPTNPTPEAGTKIAVASSGPGVDGQVAPDLGATPYLIFYDLGTGETEVIANDPAPDAGTSVLQTAQLVVDRNASAVIAGNIPPGAVQELSKLGVFSFAGVQGSVGQAIELYRSGKLQATTVTARGQGPLAAGPGGTL